jgi:putative ABC transport system permease protein
MREGATLSSAALLVDRAREPELAARLKALPAVAGVAFKRLVVESFRRTLAQNMGLTIGITVVFAGIVASGVVYNAARVSLSERARELATLRVMGFTIPEISSILLGEIAVVAIVAVPLGLVFGWIFVLGTVAAYDTEVWRMPAVISSQTMSFASVTVIVATIASSLVVRRKLDRLDLISVLKTRE